LLLTLVPLGVGVLLIISAFTGVVVWGAPREQVIMGGFYVLFSFVASNAIQKQWVLTGGWTLLGLGAWLVLNRQETESKIVAAALLGIGVAALSRELLRRRRAYLDTERRSHAYADDKAEQE
jgi:sugar (pentulose or hexulose) kinase